MHYAIITNKWLAQFNDKRYAEYKQIHFCNSIIHGNCKRFIFKSFQCSRRSHSKRTERNVQKKTTTTNISFFQINSKCNGFHANNSKLVAVQSAITIAFSVSIRLLFVHNYQSHGSSLRSESVHIGCRVRKQFSLQFFVVVIVGVAPSSSQWSWLCTHMKKLFCKNIAGGHTSIHFLAKYAWIRILPAFLL